MKGKIAEQITSMILKQLEMDDINIQDCRGQAFHNAAVMAASTHRWDILIEITGATFKRAGETRWNSRADAVKAVLIRFTKIIVALERLMEDAENTTTRSDAGLILSFFFLSFLGLWRDIPPEINDTQKHLQTKGLELQQCAIKLSASKTSLLVSRDKTVDDMLAYSTEICSEMGISPERRIRKRKRMSYEERIHAALCYDAELRREMLSMIDRLVEEITSRFERLHDIAKKYTFLTPFNLLDKKCNCDVDAFGENIKRENFLVERARLQYYLAAVDAEDMEGPLQVLQFIQKYNLIDSLPNIVILLKHFLNRAISIASCERSFSKLKLIQNHFRSTIIQTRLTDLAILSIERDLADKINFDEVIQDFAKRKARKINL
ncbi:uncharacterized protein LOC106869141 [Octopus bimaculoides]|uniref:uncharacterized protein LOC106869141 n=1 Tax=Octopus bimaculoides TaxID=37653 RepID=UPI00071C8B0D|nr:uncharacterized protein LOC106869141 [Octopus bimaculoides]|eukprot:XP_014770203.1 PREDICTED: uncharacterized protein LOC106869141 [Octopus bimaculoides]